MKPRYFGSFRIFICFFWWLAFDFDLLLTDILDFRQFCFNYTANVSQYLAADLEYGGKNLLEYIDASGELNEEQHGIWIGYSTGYEANSHENLMNKLKPILCESKKRLEKNGHCHENAGRKSESKSSKSKHGTKKVQKTEKKV